MRKRILKVHPKDSVLVAFVDFAANEQISYDDEVYELKDKIPAKHKFVILDLQPGDQVIMYGVLYRTDREKKQDVP